LRLIWTVLSKLFTRIEIVSDSTALSVIDKINDPQSFIIGMGRMFALSTMFGCKTEAQGVVLAMHCVMTKQSPLVIMQRYHFIEGKLSMKAEVMLAEFRRAGGRYEWEADGRDGKRAALKMTFDGVTYTSEYTIDEAMKAGLVKPDKPQSGWMASRPNMLRARASSNGVRMLLPEAVVGMHTPEELEDAGIITIDPADVTFKAAESTAVDLAAAAATSVETQGKRGRGRPAKQAAEATEAVAVGTSSGSSAVVTPVVAVAEIEATPVVAEAPVVAVVTVPVVVEAPVETAPAVASSADPIINEILITKSAISAIVGEEKFAEVWGKAFAALKIPTGPTDEARLMLVEEPARKKVRDWLSGQLKAAEAKVAKNDLNTWANTPPATSKHPAAAT